MKPSKRLLAYLYKLGGHATRVQFLVMYYDVDMLKAESFLKANGFIKP